MMESKIRDVVTNPNTKFPKVINRREKRKLNMTNRRLMINIHFLLLVLCGEPLTEIDL